MGRSKQDGKSTKKSTRKSTGLPPSYRTLVSPDARVRELASYCTAFELLRDKQLSLKRCASEMSLPSSTLTVLLSRVGKPYGLDADLIAEDAKKEKPPAGVGRPDTKSARLYRIIKDMLSAGGRAHDRVHDRVDQVAIAGGEWTLTWLLPRALEAGEIFQKFPGLSLDIHRARNPSERVEAIRSGAVDICVGPTPAGDVKPFGIEMKPILSVGCGYIFHESFLPRLGGRAEHVRLANLAQFPIFVVRAESAPRFQMRDQVLSSVPDARLHYVDSHIYIRNLVARRAGVGLYFRQEFDPFPLPPNAKDGVLMVPSHKDDGLSPAEFVMLTPKAEIKTLSPAAAYMVKAIEEVTKPYRNSG